MATLGAAGNRLSVSELSGRAVTYGYDDLYRLTSENVSGDPGGKNGAVSYTFDSVGNRTQRNSTLPAVVDTGLLNYDANDHTTADPYDANGNLLQSGAGGNVYDFENRVVRAGGVSLVYDGDGNRVKETVAGVTTSYLVADQNLTGYAQVMDELQGGTVSRSYTYGLSLINQRLTANGQGLSFFGFDGHGSVRYLTSSTATVTDTYDFDAFGNLISSTGSTPNNYLFAGEQFDSALGIYYNRARYYDQRIGRFWTMDTLEGSIDEPLSLHHYVYASGNPPNRRDPSGFEDIASLSVAEGISDQLDSVTAQAEQALGRKAVRVIVCEVGKCVVDLGIQEGVYLLLEEIPGGFILPYVGQTGDAITRLVTQVGEKNVFGRLLTFIEVEGGVAARRRAEQIVINVLTDGGLQPGVRSIPNAERIISNLRNEIRLDKFLAICK
jgi:RHS repeat-associated protein